MCCWTSFSRAWSDLATSDDAASRGELAGFLHNAGSVRHLLPEVSQELADEAFSGFRRELARRGDVLSDLRELQVIV